MQIRRRRVFWLTHISPEICLIRPTVFRVHNVPPPCVKCSMVQNCEIIGSVFTYFDESVRLRDITRQPSNKLENYETRSRLRAAANYFPSPSLALHFAWLRRSSLPKLPASLKKIGFDLPIRNNSGRETSSNKLSTVGHVRGRRVTDREIDTRRWQASLNTLRLFHSRICRLSLCLYVTSITRVPVNSPWNLSDTDFRHTERANTRSATTLQKWINWKKIEIKKIREGEDGDRECEVDDRASRLMTTSRPELRLIHRFLRFLIEV